MACTVDRNELGTHNEGYLLDPGDRDEVSGVMAAADGVSSTDAHRAVIRFLREAGEAGGHAPKFRNMLKGFQATRTDDDRGTTMTDDTTPQPTVTLDMRGTSCPAPLLGAKKIVDDLRPGQVLLLYSDCPGTQDDLFAWTKYTHNNIARTERQADGSHAYYIRRGRAQHLTPNAVLDLRGAVCPGPVIEAKKLLNGMRSGETLKLVSNCPGVRDDIADWVKATGYRLLEVDEIGPGEYEFFIGKA